MPEAIAQLNKLNDPLAISKRSKLMLPPPQVGDRELEDVVKASASSIMADDGADATRMLMNGYEQTPSQAAMRTPRVGGGGDTVLEEAAAQAAMLAQATPLIGGESTPLHLLGDFQGVTPKPMQQQTPNAAFPGATPGGTPMRGPGATPSRSGGLTPSRASEAGSGISSTPGRDALGINDGFDGGDLSGLPPTAQRRLQKERKAALLSQLNSIPAPQNEYKIVMPEMPEEEADEEEPMEEDALDTAAREHAEEEARQAEEMAKRSTALQQDLPRPLVVNRDVGAASAATGDTHAELRTADQMVRDEMLKMLEADAFSFPVKGAPEPKKRKPLKQLPAEAMAAAKELLAVEVAELTRAFPPPSGDDLKSSWDAASAELAYVPSQQRFAPLSSVSVAERLQVPQQQLQLIKNFMAKDAKKAGKVEKKLDVLLGGYKKRSVSLAAEIQEKQQVRFLRALYEYMCPEKCCNRSWCWIVARAARVCVMIRVCGISCEMGFVLGCSRATCL